MDKNDQNTVFKKRPFTGVIDHVLFAYCLSTWFSYCVTMVVFHYSERTLIWKDESIRLLFAPIRLPYQWYEVLSVDKYYYQIYVEMFLVLIIGVGYYWCIQKAVKKWIWLAVPFGSIAVACLSLSLLTEPASIDESNGWKRGTTGQVTHWTRSYIRYLDTNGDGRIDRKEYPYGFINGRTSLTDEDHDGVFDQKCRESYSGGFISEIHIAVPVVKTAGSGTKNY